MDNFKRHPSGHTQKTMDGFFRKPQQGVTDGLQPRTPQRPSVSTGSHLGPSSQRRVDNFKRGDGFYTQTRRNLQVSQQPRRSQMGTTLSARLNMELPEGDKRAKKTKAKQGKFATIRKWTFRTTAAGMVMLLIVGGLLFGKGYFKLQKVFQGGSSAAALSSEVDPTLLKGEGDGRVNVLLLGVGGQNHDGGDLTDTIMVASIDPVNNQAVLLSIPRDLWTKMPNNYVGNYNKINAAYESGKYKYLGKQDNSNANHKAVLAGFQAVGGVIERVAGIPIHYSMLVDFKAFGQAVDTVGGVTVNAPEELRDPSMAWENGWNSVLAKKGVNNFNGKQALNYVRSRHTSSDFARGERQRAVIVALKDKTTNLGTLTNPLKLSQLLSAFGDNVQSDISVSDMTRMATIMKKVPSSQIQSVGLADPSNSFVTTGNINGLSVVMPKAGLEDYSKIQTYIRSKLKDGYISRENANVTILNGSGVPGLATEKAEELKSYGYNVGIVDNAPTEDFAQTKIIDLSNNSKKYTLNYLKKRLNVQTIDKQVPAGIVAGQANIVIILGSDATSST
ncbi:MAG: hypothetical protein JWP13_260 [Candidatus Saccharibacteria bacterium]|nr:hypothetical protein [Candidatus Saccharibacteria bacterium]